MANTIVKEPETCKGVVLVADAISLSFFSGP